MKLSEMSIEQQAAAICDLCEPVGTLLEDARVGQVLSALSAKDGETVGELIGRAVKKIIPLLLKEHLAELVSIAAILTGKSPQEVKKGGIIGLVRDFKSSFDGELLDFFTSSAATARTKSPA